MRQISYVCGSLVNVNWFSSRFAIRMLALRALPIKSTLEQGSTTTFTGSRSIMRQGGGISPGSCSCTRRLRALLREMPLLCAYFRGLVSVLNLRWMSLLKPPCFIFPRWRRWRTLISLLWELSILKWRLLLSRQRHCEITSLSWLAYAIWDIVLRLCLHCSDNSCRGSRCLGYATSWTSCCRNLLQYVPHGLMLLGLYGPATTFVPPHMTMDIRVNRRFQLHTSSRPMTISITCGCFGVPCRSSCFLIHEWCIR